MLDAAPLAALRVIIPRGGRQLGEFDQTGVLFLRYVGVRVMKTGTVSSGAIACFFTRWRCFGETSKLVLSGL